MANRVSADFNFRPKDKEGAEEEELDFELVKKQEEIKALEEISESASLVASVKAKKAAGGKKMVIKQRKEHK